jgi:dTDP-4-amino-4,6-dideoxygalactose transaminase
VLFQSEAVLLRVLEALNKNAIYPRRYFYPSLSSLSYVSKQSTPIADSIASSVLCLPLYHDLAIEAIEEIVKITRAHI